MSSTPYLKQLLTLAIQLANSLSERIPRSESLQRDFKRLAAYLGTWPEIEFLLRPTGDKTLYSAIRLPLSELLCIQCMSPPNLSHRLTDHSCDTGQLLWTAHQQGAPPSFETLERTYEAEQKIKSASPSIKKHMDDLGVWQRPRKGHAPLAVLFNKTSRSDKAFTFVEKAVRDHISVCYEELVELRSKIAKVRKRHVGLRVLAGKPV